jgi:hypothetical protein
MDKTALLEKIKNNDLRPKGRPGCQQALVALQQLQVLGTITELDKGAAHAARRELLDVVGEYRRALRVKKMRRRKHTRG